MSDPNAVAWLNDECESLQVQIMEFGSLRVLKIGFSSNQVIELNFRFPVTNFVTGLKLFIWFFTALFSQLKLLLLAKLLQILSLVAQEKN